MPKISNLKQAVQAGKSVVGSVSGTLEEVAGAAGKGAFGVNVGPNGVSISANFNELLKKKTQGNRVVSPLKELFEDSKFDKYLIYPSDLDNEHFMIFKVMRMDRPNRYDTGKRFVYQNIVLPVPSNLQVQQGASYSDTELGIFGAMAAGQISGSDIGSATTALSDVISGKIKAATDQFKSGDNDEAMKVAGALAPAAVGGLTGTALGGVAGLLALGGASGGVTAGISRDLGLAVNPHLAVVFQGVGFRTHSFQYKFIARNQAESDQIKDIINTFKYAMLPSYEAGGLAFAYPDEFQIEFAESISPYLYDIGTSVLESVDVQYNGEGIPLFFESTGAPVSITLSMQFKEIQIHTKERLEKRMNDNV